MYGTIIDNKVSLPMTQTVTADAVEILVVSLGSVELCTPGSRWGQHGVQPGLSRGDHWSALHLLAAPPETGGIRRQ